MAANVFGSQEQLRGGDGDEDDGDEILDPRVKGELDRLNSSTAEINRLEQDLEELRATFRQTLTESAYVLKSQSAFLGNCVNQARPYYDAMRKAKQSQIETQKAALKYERACSAHQASKKVLAMAEQKLVSTSKEHKVLDPTWQEMLNSAVLKVMESDQERAQSENEHLHTARAFSEAGNKVKELRTKLKSAINKSRPYFELKMKYDQVLEAHKRQVEITQESLQTAKRKYSLALKNLEGISEEIHEMRRSRESLDMILTEREEGVGAESPVGNLSNGSVRTETESSLKDFAKSSVNNPTYGFKIALISSSGEDWQALKGKTVLLPLEERDGAPEGCCALDEQQLDQARKLEELSGKNATESEISRSQVGNRSVVLEDQMFASPLKAESIEEMPASDSSEIPSNPVCQDDKNEGSVSFFEGMEENGAQESRLPDDKEQEQLTEVNPVDSESSCFTGKHMEGGVALSCLGENVGELVANAIQQSVTKRESIREQKTKDVFVTEEVTKQISSDKAEVRSMDDNEDNVTMTTIEKGAERATETATEPVMKNATETATKTATDIVKVSATTETSTEPATLMTTRAETVTDKECIREQKTKEVFVAEEVTKQLSGDKTQVSSVDGNEDNVTKTTIETAAEPATGSTTETVVKNTTEITTEIVTEAATTETSPEPATLMTTGTETVNESSALEEVSTEATAKVTPETTTETL